MSIKPFHKLTDKLPTPRTGYLDITLGLYMAEAIGSLTPVDGAVRRMCGGYY